MASDLDLDALAPKNKTIRFNNQDISVKPPTTRQVLKLAALGQVMEAPQMLSEAESVQFEVDMNAAIADCIPELGGQVLSNSQQMAILTMIMEMGMPPENKELKERGITVDDSKKAP